MRLFKMVAPIDGLINFQPLNTESALQTAARRHARGRRQMIPTTNRSDLSFGVFSFVSTILTHECLRTSPQPDITTHCLTTEWL